MTNDFSYSVRVKNGAGWRAYPMLRLMISVGQPYHEDGKLQAVVDWANRNPCVKEIHVSVNDALQRHNLIAKGYSGEEAMGQSLMAGTAWIERNEDRLSQLNVPFFFSRWMEWMNRETFAATHQALLSLAQEDQDFKAAIETDAHALANRKIKRGESFADFDRLIQHSWNYVTEEVAVFALQAAELPAAEVYPGSNLASAEYLVGKELSEALAPLATRYFTRIDFSRIANVSRIAA